MLVPYCRSEVNCAKHENEGTEFAEENLDVLGEFRLVFQDSGHVYLLVLFTYMRYV